MKLMKNLAKFALSGALVAGLVLVASSKAEASLQILLQEDNGDCSKHLATLTASFTTEVFSATYLFGDFTLITESAKADDGRNGGTPE